MKGRGYGKGGEGEEREGKTGEGRELRGGEGTGGHPQYFIAPQFCGAVVAASRIFGSSTVFIFLAVLLPLNILNLYQSSRLYAAASS